MEQVKFSKLINRFDFVVGAMRQLPKTWDNFINCHEYYDKNKLKLITVSNYRIILDDIEFEIKNTKFIEEPLYNFKIVSIAAMDNNNLIGIGPHIPWRLSADMKRFKEITMGSPMIMGRKTFETFPKPLPGRKHFIITSNENYLRDLRFDKKDVDYSNCENFDSIESCLKFIHESNETNLEKMSKAFVIGGGQIYNQTMEIVDELNITKVVANIENLEEDLGKVSVYFPFIDGEIFEITEEERFMKDEKNDFGYIFRTFVRQKIKPNIKLSQSIIKKLIISNYTKNVYTKN